MAEAVATRSHFFIITIQWTVGVRTTTASWNGQFTDVRDDQTEEEIYKILFERACQQHGAPVGASSVLFYRLAPNDRSAT